MQVEDIDLLAIDDVEQRRQGHRVELRPLQVGDVDAQLLQRLLREVFLAKAHERHVEPFAIEPRDHPREQALDAVHPRSFPAKVIADLQHVERSICHAREPEGSDSLAIISCLDSILGLPYYQFPPNEIFAVGSQPLPPLHGLAKAGGALRR